MATAERGVTGKALPDGVHDGEGTPQTTFPPLANDEWLYRAVLQPDWFKKGKLKDRVFMRRPPTIDGQERDAAGLSVALAAGRSEPDTCAAEAAPFNDCQFVCNISVSTVRATAKQIGLSTELDAIQDRVNHANITGLPPVPPSDIATVEGQAERAEARRIGDELAKRAAVVWTKP